MKTQKHPVLRSFQHPLDPWIWLTLIVATAVAVAAIPLVYSSSIVHPANGTPVLGEAGLWSDLADKENP